MSNAVAVLEQLLVTEDWELGRQVLVDASVFADDAQRLEAEFDVSLRHLEMIFDLPDADRMRLKREILARFEARLRDYNDDLYQKICVELGYCANKEAWKWRAAEYLAGALDILFGGGGIALAVLLLKREYLDKLCKCPK